MTLALAETLTTVKITALKIDLARLLGGQKIDPDRLPEDHLTDPAHHHTDPVTDLAPHRAGPLIGPALQSEDQRTDHVLRQGDLLHGMVDTIADKHGARHDGTPRAAG